MAGKREELRQVPKQRQEERRRRAGEVALLLKRLQALADARRLGILEMLGDGSRCVCDLQGQLPLPQPLLSHHLKVLREAGLVSCRRAGRWAYYETAPGALEEVRTQLAALQPEVGPALHDSGKP